MHPLLANIAWSRLPGQGRARFPFLPPLPPPAFPLRPLPPLSLADGKLTFPRLMFTCWVLLPSELTDLQTCKAAAAHSGPIPPNPGSSLLPAPPHTPCLHSTASVLCLTPAHLPRISLVGLFLGLPSTPVRGSLSIPGIPWPHLGLPTGSSYRQGPCHP